MKFIDRIYLNFYNILSVMSQLIAKRQFEKFIGSVVSESSVETIGD